MHNNRLLLVVLALAMCLLLSGCSEEINTVKILHANINCSNFEESLSFYEMLGFASLLESDVVVSEEDAAGLHMPAYQLHAATMTLRDYYLIDLIEWAEPYDPDPPYALMNHLGLSHISLKTTNLDADMTILQGQGVVFFSDPVTIDRPVENSRLVCFKDPDGTLIELIEPGGAVSGQPNPSGTYITGTLGTNVNCSDFEASQSFYNRLGFKTKVEVEEEGTPELATALGLPSYHVRASTMALPYGSSLNLTRWEDPFDANVPYEHLNHIGIARIAILTLNLDADILSLGSQGVEFYSDPIRPEGDFGFLRFVCFEDPDGTVIELVQLF
jgi:catechol 2,3-dioxygenase-like lactoylglutathione lyase family enzyme